MRAMHEYTERNTHAQRRQMESAARAGPGDSFSPHPRTGTGRVTDCELPRGRWTCSPPRLEGIQEVAPPSWGCLPPASCSQRQWKPVSCLSPRMTLGIRQKGNEGVSVTLLVVADGGSLPALSVGTMPAGKGVGIELEPGLEPGDRERWRGPLLPPSCPHSTHNPQTTCSNPDT